jgi:hypothetical protein
MFNNPHNPGMTAVKAEYDRLLITCSKNNTFIECLSTKLSIDGLITFYLDKICVSILVGLPFTYRFPLTHQVKLKREDGGALSERGLQRNGI